MEIASKASHNFRSADRLLEALATVSALLDRSINEVKALDAEFQERLLQAVHDTEVSLQSQASEHMEKALSDARDKIREEMTTTFEAQMDAIRAGLEGEAERLSRELTRATEAGAQLEVDRERLTAELERTRNEARAALEKAQDEKRADSADSPNPTALGEEITRAEGRLQELLTIINDPATELSTVIRKNVERSEIEAYLKGIRYVLNNGK